MGPDRQPGMKWHHTVTPLPHGQNDWHTLTCTNCSIPRLRCQSGRCVVLLNAGSKKSTILRPAVIDKTRIQRYDVRPLANSVHVHGPCTFYCFLNTFLILRILDKLWFHLIYMSVSLINNVCSFVITGLAGVYRF